VGNGFLEEELTLALVGMFTFYLLERFSYHAIPIDGIMERTLTPIAFQSPFPYHACLMKL